MTEERKSNLHDIEPLRRVEDLEPPDAAPTADVDRDGQPTASTDSERQPGPQDDDPLEALRRG